MILLIAWNRRFSAGGGPWRTICGRQGVKEGGGQDKRTAGSRGPCGWLGGIFLYGRRVGVPALIPENHDSSLKSCMAAQLPMSA